MSTTYFQHALNCGINMTGKLALPVSESAGSLVMVDVINPVTLETVIPSGCTMDVQLIDVAESLGVDYVVVYHRQFPFAHN